MPQSRHLQSRLYAFVFEGPGPGATAEGCDFLGVGPTLLNKPDPGILFRDSKRLTGSSCLNKGFPCGFQGVVVISEQCT